MKKIQKLNKHILAENYERFFRVKLIKEDSEYQDVYANLIVNHWENHDMANFPIDLFEEITDKDLARRLEQLENEINSGEEPPEADDSVMYDWDEIVDEALKHIGEVVTKGFDVDIEVGGEDDVRSITITGKISQEVIEKLESLNFDVD